MSTNFASSNKAEILIHYAEAKYEEYSRFAGHRDMASIYIHVLSIALCLSAGFQQGYIAVVLNQPYLEITKFINDSWMERYDEPLQENILDVLWSFLNVCFPIATIAGQFLAAYLCDHIGRKNTALLASAVYIPGVLLCTASKENYPYFEQLFIGRILWSLANGINSVNATVWIIECAPARIRGRMSAMQEFFLAFGSLVTQALGVPFSNEKLWPLIFLPNLAFVLVSMAMFAFVYESPQYILEKYGDEEKAKLALAAYYGVSITDRTLTTEIAVYENCTREHEQTKAKPHEDEVPTLVHERRPPQQILELGKRKKKRKTN